MTDAHRAKTGTIFVMPTAFMCHAMLVRLLGIGVPTNPLAITRLALIDADVELRILPAPLCVL